MNVLLLLVNEYGVEVGGGICRNSNPIDCIDKHALGDDDIEVLIMDPVEGMMDVHAIFSLRRLPTSRAFHDGYNLFQHQLDNVIRFNEQTRLQTQ